MCIVISVSLISSAKKGKKRQRTSEDTPEHSDSEADEVDNAYAEHTLKGEDLHVLDLHVLDLRVLDLRVLNLHVLNLHDNDIVTMSCYQHLYGITVFFQSYINPDI